MGNIWTISDLSLDDILTMFGQYFDNYCENLGRVHTDNPLARETFYLRMLLHHDQCKGKTSFADLQKLENGNVCNTYKKVCRELGLLKDDLE